MSAPAVSVNIKCVCGLHIFTVLVIGWQYVFDYLTALILTNVSVFFCSDISILWAKAHIMGRCWKSPLTDPYTCRENLTVAFLVSSSAT